MAEATRTQVAAQTTPPKLDEWMKRYAEQPVEVVEGELVVMSPPELRHVRIARDLFLSLAAFAAEHNLGEVWPDNTAYVLEGDDRSDWVRGARVPDVSFVSRKGMQAHLEKYGEEGPLRLAPDLAVEIISPTDKYIEVTQKVSDYLRYGVNLVWVIDPVRQTVRVHTPDVPDGRTLESGETLSGDPMLPGWSAVIADLFPDEPLPSQPAKAE